MPRWIILALILVNSTVGQAQTKPQTQPQTQSTGDWYKDYPPAIRNVFTGKFSWNTGEPLISPANRAEDPCHAIKDPSIVQYDGRWHLFCTIRSEKRTHQIEYLSFSDWNQANQAERHVLKLTEGYFCAPQIFYFEPQKKWYLIYQINEPTRKPSLQPAYSTTDDISKPESWSQPTLLFAEHPRNILNWIDFWVICDDQRAYLFFTSMDGHLWRCQTKRDDFPTGWTRPVACLEDDIFEASHTYKLKGFRKYLTIVEAIGDNGRRYYKAFISNYLNGGWEDLASSKKQPFAGRDNIRQDAQQWVDSVSHGELLRTGYDQEMEVDPMQLRFLFQGVSDKEKAGKSYGQIPWRLGILEPAE
jgi:hypothetical protein